MSNWVEPLEGRTLFSVAPIPSNVAAADATVGADQQQLRLDAQTATASLHGDAAALEQDVQQIGITRVNLVLGKKVLAAGTKYLAVLNSDTRVVTAKLTPVLKKVETTEAAYVAKPTLGNESRLLAADKLAASVETLSQKLTTAAGNTGAIDATLTNLADANAGVAFLNNDIANTVAAAGTLATTIDGHVAALVVDLNTFVDLVGHA